MNELYWRIPILLLALAGCRFSADYDGTSFACTDEATCPEGQSCVDGFCVAPGGDGQPDAAPGAAGADAAPVSGGEPDADLGPQCVLGATMSVIDDTFDDGAAPPLWQITTVGDASYAENAGRARFTVGPGGDVRLATPCLYNATDNAMTLEALDIDLGVDASVYLRLVRTPGEVASITVGDDTIYIEVLAPGGMNQTRTLPANAADRYYRVSASGNTFRFERSPDGVTWDMFSSHGVPFDITQVNVLLGAKGGAGSAVISVDRARGGAAP